MSGGNSRSYCLPRWAGQGDRLGNPPWSNTRPARPGLGDTATGLLGDHFTDLSTPGRLPLTFTRTYNGSIADPTCPNASAAHDGPFGYGWTFSYNMSAATDPGTGNVTVTQEDGSAVGFVNNSGTYSTAAPRYDATLTRTGTAYTYTRGGRSIFTFDTASGHLTASTDLAGSKASP